MDFPNDEKIHFVEVVYSKIEIDSSDQHLYIQPNRREQFSLVYELEISKIKILNLNNKYEISNHFNGQSHIGYLRDNAFVGSDEVTDYNWRPL